MDKLKKKFEGNADYAQPYPRLPEQIAALRADVEVQTIEFQPDPHSSRLTEMSKIEKQMADEEEHYRTVLKTYKKAGKMVFYSSAGLGGASVALSSSGLAAALIGVGIVVGARLGAVGFVCGFASTALAASNKKLAKRSKTRQGSLSCCCGTLALGTRMVRPVTSHANQEFVD